MSKILTMGEVLWDIFPGGRELGGAPLNAAAHYTALGNRAVVLSRVGGDKAGREAVSLVERLGVDTAYIQRDTLRPTGTATVTLDSAGTPEYDIPFEVGYNYIEVNSEIIADLNNSKFDAVYFGTMAQKGATSRVSIRSVLGGVNTAHVYFDANFRQGFYPAETLDYSLDKATIVKMSGEEAAITSELLFGEPFANGGFAGRLIERYNLDCLLITHGGDGCEVYNSGKCGRVTAVSVEVGDTVGAGDAFSAGFLHEYLQTGDAFSAAVFANATGAFVASKRGALPALDRETINGYARSLRCSFEWRF